MIFSTKAIQRGLYKNELSIGSFLDNANTPCVCAHRHGVPKKPVPVGLYETVNALLCFRIHSIHYMLRVVVVVVVFKKHWIQPESLMSFLSYTEYQLAKVIMLTK